MPVNPTPLTLHVVERAWNPQWIVSCDYLSHVSLRFQKQTRPPVRVDHGELINALAALFLRGEMKLQIKERRLDPATIDLESRNIIKLKEREARFYAAYRFSGAGELIGKSKLLGYGPRQGEPVLRGIWRGKRLLPDRRLKDAAKMTLCDEGWLRADAAPFDNYAEQEARLLTIPTSLIEAVMHVEAYLPSTVTTAPDWAHPYILARFMTIQRHLVLEMSNLPSFAALPSRLPQPRWLSNHE